ncbi:MAG: flagellar type III secretion system pore protein FliP [Gammaproteobacteria bacterium]|nr:flagellar type III secretion system pore protein FliP [Gammaproteobacteria bacterium]MCP4979177.1 flagellar type III secretion system pore protein FliP [Gammaproteobacteria bacterium]
MKFRFALFLILMVPEVQAQSAGIPAISIDGGSGDGQTYTVTLEILALMTMLTLLPAILLMMTSFTRIIIVLSILRQALGTAQTPSNQIILGLALFLTLFVMSPVFDQVYQVAMQPYLNGSMSAMDAMQAATEPFKTFMLAQTRETDIRMFADIAGVAEIESPEKTPFTLLMPAFVTSELKTAFQIGFLIFIPFVVIDLVVASVLMSMGMMMLSPMIISLPFKLMLFVLVDGWALIMGTLASSFLLGA